MGRTPAVEAAVAEACIKRSFVDATYTVEQQLAATMIQATERRRKMRNVNAVDGNANVKSSSVIKASDLILPLTSTLRTLEKPDVVQHSIVDLVGLQESQSALPVPRGCSSTIEEQNVVSSVPIHQILEGDRKISKTYPMEAVGNAVVQEVDLMGPSTTVISSAPSEMEAAVESSVATSVALSEMTIVGSSEASTAALLSPCPTLGAPYSTAAQTRTNEIAATAAEASITIARLVSRASSMLYHLLRCAKRAPTSTNDSLSAAEAVV